MALTREKAFARLEAARKAGRLAHACLLTGPAGAPTEPLATDLAAAILDTTTALLAEHPDLHRVEPGSKTRRIVIDQIRDLERSLRRKPLLGGSKVALLLEADRLQPQAANAFLKTLEEPPDNCHIILTTELREAVLPTILSRCVAVPLAIAKDAPTDPLADTIRTALADALLESGTGASFAFASFFRTTLATLREDMSAELDADLKQQVKRYGESADKHWKDSRETRNKARTEGHAAGQRRKLLAAAASLLAEALRHHADPAAPASDHAVRLARSNDTRTLLRRLEALERLEKMLAAGVQEQLALESGFLQIIAGR
jgi:DNA polymerase III subunit delta'